jgi:hypothetical protein
MEAGRALLRTVAALTAVGGFAADWNRTHLFNPHWPPHARFHDAMTISLGTVLGGTALLALRRPRNQRDVVLGAALPAMFWLSMGAAFAFPGAEGLEAEFPQLVPRVGGVWLDERFASASMLSLSALGLVLEHRAGRCDEADNHPLAASPSADRERTPLRCA